jgi:hypothetical protein
MIYSFDQILSALALIFSPFFYCGFPVVFIALVKLEKLGIVTGIIRTVTGGDHDIIHAK